MKAFECDRCGKFERGDSVRLQTYPDSFHWGQRNWDESTGELCSSCAAEFKSWIENKTSKVAYSYMLEEKYR